MTVDEGEKDRLNGTVADADGDGAVQTLQSPGRWWCSTRFSIAIMGLLALLCMNAMRVSMAVAIVCMVNHTAIEKQRELKENGGSPNMSFSPAAEDDCPVISVDTVNFSRQIVPGANDEDGQFLWDKTIQGLVLSSFFWGYMIAQIPAGWLASRFGGKRIIGGFLLATTISTLLTPIGAQTHYKLLIFLRFIAGMGGCVVYPGLHAMWGNWAPPMERSRLAGISYAGGQLGNVIGMPVAGLLCEYGFAGGWPAVFYVLGAVSMIWFVLWMFLVSDSPTNHPRISAAEKAYIVDSLKGQTRVINTKLNVPWLSFATSMAVWAIIVSNVCCDWALYTFETQTPTYLKEVLKFDIKSNGLISSVPYIGYWAVITFAGLLADYLRSHKILSTGATRKLMDSIGKITMAVLVVGLGFISCSLWQVAVTLLIIGISLQGFQFSGFLVNHVDIAPPYAGILFGISNSIAALCGIAAPTVTSILTKNGTRQEWQTVFYITASISTFGAIFFCIFAKGELQPWAKQPTTDTPEEEKLKTDVEKVSQV